MAGQGHLHLKIKEAAINLLVSGQNFSSNMDFLDVFDTPFRPGITARLQYLGGLLKVRFDELNLGTELGDAAIDLIIIIRVLLLNKKI